MKSLSASGNIKYAIIIQLQRHGPLSRIDLARRTGVSPSSITSAVSGLIKDGIIFETALKGNTGQGRPPVAISLVPKVGAAVGIEFGFRHVRGVIVDLSYDILANEQVELGMDYSVSTGIEATLDIIENLKKKSGLGDKDLIGVGLGFSSPTDLSGMPTRSSMIPHWSGTNVRQLLTNRLQVPLVIENETRLSARGETVWGAARGVDDFVYLKLHSGVCGAVFANGMFITGKNGGAGEVGHISLDPAGPQCRCGNRGCFELYASIPAVLARVRPTYPDIDLKRLFTLYAANDPTITEVMADTGRKVAQLLAILCNTVNPELILIGGALSGAGQTFIDGIEADMQPLILELNRSPRIAVGSLGAMASALGGVARVFELFVNDQLYGVMSS